MKLVLIFGPPAVGKMTVGQALASITDLKLFHNHMSLELVNQFFDFGTPSFNKLDKAIRFSIFEAIAASDLDGLIFTIVWSFNEKEDEAYIDEIVAIFKKYKPQTQVSFVELKADLEKRLERNKHEKRLEQKPSKRDVAFSEKALLSFEKDYRMNTLDGELPEKAIFKIDNSNLSPDEVAQMIKVHYQL